MKCFETIGGAYLSHSHVHNSFECVGNQFFQAEFKIFQPGILLGSYRKVLIKFNFLDMLCSFSDGELLQLICFSNTSRSCSKKFAKHNADKRLCEKITRLNILPTFMLQYFQH